MSTTSLLSCFIPSSVSLQGGYAEVCADGSYTRSSSPSSSDENNTLLDTLRTTQKNHIPVFSLNGYISYAKMVSNYDGDTCNIVFPYHGMLMHMRARMTGYDTSEIKPSLNDPHRDIKKKKALAAKERLWQLCTNSQSEPGTFHTHLIVIKCGEFDKYGRLLVTAFPYDTDMKSIIDDSPDVFHMSINHRMISEGHGYVYNGGTKDGKFFASLS